jgi:hypothetical protein
MTLDVFEALALGHALFIFFDRFKIFLLGVERIALFFDFGQSVH